MVLTPMLGPLIVIALIMVTFGDIIIKIITILPGLFKLALKIFNPDVFIHNDITSWWNSRNIKSRSKSKE